MFAGGVELGLGTEDTFFGAAVAVLDIVTMTIGLVVFLNISPRPQQLFGRGNPTKQEASSCDKACGPPLVNKKAHPFGTIPSPRQTLYRCSDQVVCRSLEQFEWGSAFITVHPKLELTGQGNL